MTNDSEEYTYGLVAKTFKAIASGTSLDGFIQRPNDYGRQAKISTVLETGQRLSGELAQNHHEFVEQAFQFLDVQRPSWSVADCCRAILGSRISGAEA